MIRIVIDGLAKAGNTKRALEFLRLMEMEILNLIPSCITAFLTPSARI
jgi:pentatricopeptide repeat protein